MQPAPPRSPLVDTVLQFCQVQLAEQAQRPLLVGVQGPQGAGKTTLAAHTIAALPALGLRGASVSIDDFYLTRSAQLQLAAAHAGNPYLEHRGYPGTHDIELGERTLAACREASKRPVVLPVYDKSACEGRGDRAPVERFGSIERPFDLLFVEGWMLGFTAVPESSLGDPWLRAPNRALADYERWHRHIDAWVILRALDPEYVLTWRVEAEERMRQRGLPGLSRADIEDYIRRFLPAYRTWAGAPASVPPHRRIDVTLDLARMPQVAKEEGA